MLANWIDWEPAETSCRFASAGVRQHGFAPLEPLSLGLWLIQQRLLKQQCQNSVEP
jgi:hypothetical protein